MSKWGHLGMVMCLLLSTPAWASIGKVSLLKGEATASRNNQSIELMNGTNIEEHDFIATRANSQIQLTFEDKTVITLGSESTLDIQDYLNDANNPKAKFKFNQGTFKTITGQIGKKAPENFNLETKTATIGIRGTIVGGIVTSGSIFCLSGTITVAPLGMPNVINVVPTGQVIHVRTPDAPPAPPAPFTPAELQQLNQNSGGALPPQGNNGQQDGGSNTPPPPPPNGAEQATQTKQQTTIVDNIDTQVVIIQNSFYPVFNPTLQAASTNVETVELSGYATSQFKQGGTTYVSTHDTFSLYLNTSNDSIDDSIIRLDRFTHEDSFSLSKTADASTMTYKNLNEFSIKDFENHSSWMQTEKTYENDYVSWGYWAMKVNDDTKLLPTKNYWVAGKDSSAAIAHITGLTTSTHYIYTGKVLGSVAEDGVFYTIASDTSSVQLKFDFGGGSNALFNDPSYSWIRFSANGKDWNLAPTLATTRTVIDGEFSDSLTGTVTQGQSSTAITSGAIQGKFYGNQAQAVGGTFNATTGTSTAFGVYKATK